MRVTCDCGGVSKVKRSFRKEADINNIIKRYKKTGILSSNNVLSVAGGVYGDFTSAVDYTTMMQKMARVTQFFEMLPAVVRKRFSNSPAEMLAFVKDPVNKDEGIKLGLFEKDRSMIRYIDQKTGKVTNFKGEVVGSWSKETGIIENTPAPAPGAGGAQA